MPQRHQRDINDTKRNALVMDATRVQHSCAKQPLGAAVVVDLVGGAQGVYLVPVRAD